jgi:hypothetical protein
VIGGLALTNYCHGLVTITPSARRRKALVRTTPLVSRWIERLLAGQKFFPYL